MITVPDLLDYACAGKASNLSASCWLQGGVWSVQEAEVAGKILLQKLGAIALLAR